MIMECPIACPNDDISICVECDYFGYVADLLAESKEKCYNNTNEDKDKVAPNQS